LNGVNISEFLTPTVAAVKTIGVVLAVTGSLVVGREGPLVHIGSAIAIIVLFLPESYFKQNEFRTSEKYREFLAAGVSAGVSVAFGAPIGGALFAYEISGPATFWTF
jgi:H+/Cl- antiporter ClcA